MQPDLSMTSAIYPSLLFGKALPLPPVLNCPSSNCTFDPFQSLGVCGTCKEMPDLLKFGCFPVLSDWQRDNDTNPFLLDQNNNTLVVNVTTCGYYLMPDGMQPILMTGYSTESPVNGKPQELLGGRMVPLRDLWTRQPLYPNGTLAFHEIQNPIADFITAFVPGGGAGAYLNHTPVVHECNVNWCLQTIQSKVDGIHLKEEVTATRRLDTNFVARPWDDPRVYRPSFNLTVPAISATDGTATNFGVSNITARAVIQAWEIFVPSSWTAFSATGDLFAKIGWRGSEWRLEPERANPWLGNNPVQHIQDMAKAMSIALRRTPKATTDDFDLITGKTWEPRVHVHIRWPWIVLPALLLLISFVFLILTMARSSKDDRGIGIWKTSALAVLFNGLGDDVQHMMGGEAPAKMGQARTTAKNLTVHLDQD
jgi:hypothetical protein